MCNGTHTIAKALLQDISDLNDEQTKIADGIDDPNCEENMKVSLTLQKDFIDQLMVILKTSTIHREETAG